jgi:hypothetical protein
MLKDTVHYNKEYMENIKKLIKQLPLSLTVTVPYSFQINATPNRKPLVVSFTSQDKKHIMDFTEATSKKISANKTYTKKLLLSAIILSDSKPEFLDLVKFLLFQGVSFKSPAEIDSDYASIPYLRAFSHTAQIYSYIKLSTIDQDKALKDSLTASFKTEAPDSLHIILRKAIKTKNLDLIKLIVPQYIKDDELKKDLTYLLHVFLSFNSKACRTKIDSNLEHQEAYDKILHYFLTNGLNPKDPFENKDIMNYFREDFIRNNARISFALDPNATKYKITPDEEQEFQDLFSLFSLTVIHKFTESMRNIYMRNNFGFIGDGVMSGIILNCEKDDIVKLLTKYRSSQDTFSVACIILQNPNNSDPQKLEMLRIMAETAIHQKDKPMLDDIIIAHIILAGRFTDFLPTLVDENKIDVNHKVLSFSLLEMLLVSGNTKVATLLLDRGADYSDINPSLNLSKELQDFIAKYVEGKSFKQPDFQIFCMLPLVILASGIKEILQLQLKVEAGNNRYNLKKQHLKILTCGINKIIIEPVDLVYKEEDFNQKSPNEQLDLMTRANLSFLRVKITIPNEVSGRQDDTSKIFVIGAKYSVLVSGPMLDFVTQNLLYKDKSQKFEETTPKPSPQLKNPDHISQSTDQFDASGAQRRLLITKAQHFQNHLAAISTSQDQELTLEQLKIKINSLQQDIFGQKLFDSNEIKEGTLRDVFGSFYRARKDIALKYLRSKDVTDRLQYLQTKQLYNLLILLTGKMYEDAIRKIKDIKSEEDLRAQQGRVTEMEYLIFDVLEQQATFNIPKTRSAQVTENVEKYIPKADDSFTNFAQIFNQNQISQYDDEDIEKIGSLLSKKMQDESNANILDNFLNVCVNYLEKSFDENFALNAVNIRKLVKQFPENCNNWKEKFKARLYNRFDKKSGADINLEDLAAFMVAIDLIFYRDDILSDDMLEKEILECKETLRPAIIENPTQDQSENIKAITETISDLYLEEKYTIILGAISHGHQVENPHIKYNLKQLIDHNLCTEINKLNEKLGKYKIKGLTQEILYEFAETLQNFTQEKSRGSGAHNFCTVLPALIPNKKSTLSESEQKNYADRLVAASNGRLSIEIAQDRGSASQSYAKSGKMTSATR